MQLKIWHKMIIGISIPSLIAVAGSILTYEYLNNVKNRQSFVQVADDIKERLLEARRNEKNFLHFKNEEQFKNLHIPFFELMHRGPDDKNNGGLTSIIELFFRFVILEELGGCSGEITAQTTLARCQLGSVGLSTSQSQPSSFAAHSL